MNAQSHIFHITPNEEPDMPVIEIHYGIITTKEADCFTIASSGRTFQARRALACLLEPEVGDKVIFSATQEDEGYILTILAGNSERRNRLDFHGDVEVASQGRMTFLGHGGLEMATGKDISLLSNELSLKAVHGEMQTGSFAFSSGYFQGKLEKGKLIAKSLDTIFDRLSQRIKHSFRFVEELDQVKAGAINYLAEKCMSLRGNHTVLTAKEDVKIDGERVHMG